MTTLSDYMTIAKNQAKWQAITAKKPDIALQTKYFTDNIGKVKSADDLIKNPRLFSYAMTAFGLSDMTYAKGLMKKVLQQGVSDTKALARTLNNPSILAFAKAFDFKSNGASTTSSNTLVKQVVDSYTETQLENDQGQQNPGVQLAMYFQQHAPKLTSTYGIMADKKILNVVQTALGISPMTSAQPVDQQAKLLGAKVNIADFKDPKKLQAFIARFAAMYDSQNAQSAAPAPSYDNAIVADGTAGVDFSLLLKLKSPGGLTI